MWYSFWGCNNKKIAFSQRLQFLTGNNAKKNKKTLGQTWFSVPERKAAFPAEFPHLSRRLHPPWVCVYYLCGQHRYSATLLTARFLQLLGRKTILTWDKRRHGGQKQTEDGWRRTKWWSLSPRGEWSKGEGHRTTENVRATTRCRSSWWVRPVVGRLCSAAPLRLQTPPWWHLLTINYACIDSNWKINHKLM